MKTSNKILSILTLVALIALAMPIPALAFDGRGGDAIVIEENEVIEDDLYVGAETFVLDGTVKGDLVVAARIITINGTVDGDLIAAGQAVIIDGTVTDDARIAGAALQLGSNANIGGDLVSAGASLETQSGSKVAGELVVGSAQALLAGDVSSDVLAGTAALKMSGTFEGDVQAYVDVTTETESSMPLNMYMTDMPISIPSVQPGLTITDDAKIDGNFKYTSTIDLKIPSNVVDGKVTREEPAIEAHAVEIQPTPAQLAGNWVLDLIRSIVTLILFGLLLGWLFPSFIKNLTDKLQAEPAASLGWGLVAYAAFFFLILLVVVVMIIGGVFFGFLTLGGISGTIVSLGILAVFELILGFVLVTVFLTKIIVAWLGGRLIINRFNPVLADHKVWPLVLGVVIIALLVALPFIGWLFGWIVMFLGLGALWLWGRGLWLARRTV